MLHAAGILEATLVAISKMPVNDAVRCLGLCDSIRDARNDLMDLYRDYGMDAH